MVWSWQYVATFVEKHYGSYVDWNEEFFICPVCGELIYKCDYSIMDLGMICPVCEATIETKEEE